MNVLDYLNERHQPIDVNKLHRESLKLQDKIALIITTAVGTMYAVYFFGLVMAGWIVWQTYFDKQPFDPFPFVFLLFLGNIVQLLLMPLIMVGQNVQGKHAKIRAEEEFRTTQSSYKDIEQILVHLDKQDKQMKDQLDMLIELSKHLKQQSK